MLRYILILLLAFSANALLRVHNPCTKVGVYPLIDNTPAFYRCYLNEVGELTIKFLHCHAGHVFNAEAGICVPMMRIKQIETAAAAAGDDDGDESPIEDPTTPPPTTTTTPSDIENPTQPPPESTTHFADTTEEGSGGDATETTEHTSEGAETTETTETSTGGGETTGTPEDTTTSDHTESTETSTGGGETTGTPEDTTTSDHTETTDNSETSTGGTETTGDDTETTGETETTTESGETTTPRPFHCPTTGFFPTDGTCDQYVYCRSVNNSLIAYPLQCPSGLQFDPDNEICVADYDCDEGGDIEPQNQIGVNFNCVSEGSFADRYDCAKYFKCAWNQKANKFQHIHRTCPEGQVYHLLTGNCGRRGKLTCLGRSLYDH